MARFFQDYTMMDAPENSFAAIHQYLTGRGFTYKTYQGEQVFQKGKGILTGPTFVKVSYFPDRVRAEAWMKFAILPGVYTGEIGIDGFLGWAAKGPMKEAAIMMDRVLGGPAARMGCHPFLRNVNMGGQPQGYPQQQAYIPQGYPQQQGYGQNNGWQR